MNRPTNLILENASSIKQFSTQNRRRILVKFRFNFLPNRKLTSKSKLPDEIFTINRHRKTSIKNALRIIDSKSKWNCGRIFHPQYIIYVEIESLFHNEKWKFLDEISTIEFSLLKTCHQSTHFRLKFDIEFWLIFHQPEIAGFSIVNLVCRNIISIIYPFIVRCYQWIDFLVYISVGGQFTLGYTGK